MFSTTFRMAVQKLAEFCDFFTRVKGKVSKLGLSVKQALLNDRSISRGYRFGLQMIVPIRRDRPAPSDKWHLDEVVITIRGEPL